MDNRKIKTLGELKKNGYVSKSIKQELRDNLIKKIQAKENPFPGILGYEDSVINLAIFVFACPRNPKNKILCCDNNALSVSGITESS